jgi:hypothetical protein
VVVTASALLTAAGRSRLLPLGIKQKGRSRTWLDDHGWWIGVIEFQPSSWSKGSYLNVGVMWMWNTVDHIVFDLHQRVAGHTRYEDDDQFKAEAERLAAAAAEGIGSYRQAIPDLATAALHLSEESPRSPAIHRDAGMAYALMGDVTNSREHLRSFAALDGDRDWEILQREEALALVALEDSTALREAVEGRVTRCRSVLGLGN